MKHDAMEKTLMEIRDRAAVVREEYSGKEADAREALRAAEAEKREAQRASEETLTEADFEEAEARIRDAERKAAFQTRLLEHLKYSPRMDEAEYDQAVETCRKFAEEARDKFRKAAQEHLSKLKSEREEYDAVICAINDTLKELDAGANVLQSRYKKRVVRRQNMDPVSVDDPYEWKRHALRINGPSYFFGAKDPERPWTQFNSVYLTAWNATISGQAYPEHIF